MLGCLCSGCSAWACHWLSRCTCTCERKAARPNPSFERTASPPLNSNVRHHEITHAPFVAVLCLTVLCACTDGGGYFLEAKPSTAASAASAIATDGKGLILPLEVDQQVAEAFVRMGFGLNDKQHFQSTEFLTPQLRTAQATPLIRLVKEYNEFNGELVAAAVERLRGRVSGVEFGREGSPVLYIELPYWTHQREETVPRGMGTKITDGENDRFVAELRQAFVSDLKAGEFSVNHRRVRIWWD